MTAPTGRISTRLSLGALSVPPNVSWLRRHVSTLPRDVSRLRAAFLAKLATVQPDLSRGGSASNFPALTSVQPASPGYAPNSPASSPTSPGFVPTSPQYSPTSPGFTPIPPQYSSVSPMYSPTSPTTTPRRISSHSPAYSPAASGFAPYSPQHISISPPFVPTSPQYYSPTVSMNLSVAASGRVTMVGSARVAQPWDFEDFEDEVMFESD